MSKQVSVPMIINLLNRARRRTKGWLLNSVCVYVSIYMYVCVLLLLCITIEMEGNTSSGNQSYIIDNINLPTSKRKKNTTHIYIYI